MARVEESEKYSGGLPDTELTCECCAFQDGENCSKGHDLGETVATCQDFVEDV